MAKWKRHQSDRPGAPDDEVGLLAVWAAVLI